MAIVKAERQQRKLRLAIFGPTGSGKTLTALKIARGIVGPNGRIGMIDTENNSASLYADTVNFDTLSPPMTTFAPGEYVKALNEFIAANYDIVVIDSLSHAWMGKDGALERVDKAATRSSGSGGNSFAAWREVTPQHNAMVESLVHAPVHIIVTMRSKMEYVLQPNERGKMVPTKIGLQPIQRDGMEYEFDICADMDLDHNWKTGKTRCSVLDGRQIPNPDERLGQEVIAWLKEGKVAPPPVMAAAPAPVPFKTQLANEIVRVFRLDPKGRLFRFTAMGVIRAAGVKGEPPFTEDQYRAAFDWLAMADNVDLAQISADAVAAERETPPPATAPQSGVSAPPAPTPAPAPTTPPAPPAAAGGPDLLSPTTVTVRGCVLLGEGTDGKRPWKRWGIQTDHGPFETYSSTVSTLASVATGCLVKLTWTGDKQRGRDVKKLEPLSGTPIEAPAAKPAPQPARVTVPADTGTITEEDIPF